MRVVVYDDSGSLVTDRRSEKISGKLYRVIDTNGDYWQVELPITAGPNAMAQRILKKPTTGVVRAKRELSDNKSYVNLSENR